MFKKKINKSKLATIAQNRHARYDYFIEEEMEAGLVLQGWEVKSLRAGKVNISDSYVVLKNGEAHLFGAIITPLSEADTHIIYETRRNRKLLLNKRQINSLFSRVNREGYTVVAISIYWKKVWSKIKIGVAKGKKYHDKRAILKDKEWRIDKSRMMKITNRI